MGMREGINDRRFPRALIFIFLEGYKPFLQMSFAFLDKWGVRSVCSMHGFRFKDAAATCTWPVPSYQLIPGIEK